MGLKKIEKAYSSKKLTAQKADSSKKLKAHKAQKG